METTVGLSQRSLVIRIMPDFTSISPLRRTLFTCRRNQPNLRIRESNIKRIKDFLILVILPTGPGVYQHRLYHSTEEDETNVTMGPPVICLAQAKSTLAAEIPFVLPISSAAIWTGPPGHLVRGARAVNGSTAISYLWQLSRIWRIRGRL